MEPLHSVARFSVHPQSPLAYYAKVRTQLESHAVELSEYRKDLERFLEHSMVWRNLMSHDPEGGVPPAPNVCEAVVPGARTIHDLDRVDLDMVDLLCAMHFARHYQHCLDAMERQGGGGSSPIENLLARMEGDGKKKNAPPKNPFDGLRFEEQWKVRMRDGEFVTPSPTPAILAAGIDGSLFLRPHLVPASFDQAFFPHGSAWSRLHFQRTGPSEQTHWLWWKGTHLYVGVDVRKLMKQLQQQLDTARAISRVTQGESY